MVRGRWQPSASGGWIGTHPGSRHFADPWGTHFVHGDAEDMVPVVASEQLTITHDALPFEGACPHCGSTETDGSPCPWSLVCPLCMALPGDPCRRPTGHLEQVMHEDRVRAAEGRG